jgi:hypothetical protein
LRSSNKKNTFIFNLDGLHPKPLRSPFILINSKIGDMQFSVAHFSFFLTELFRNLVHSFQVMLFFRPDPGETAPPNRCYN